MIRLQETSRIRELPRASGRQLDAGQEGQLDRIGVERARRDGLSAHRALAVVREGRSGKTEKQNRKGKEPDHGSSLFKETNAREQAKLRLRDRHFVERAAAIGEEGLNVGKGRRRGV